jgi:tRNA modification GTPase
MGSTRDDTILALATGPLPSALALFRVSGPQALDVARSLLQGGPLPSDRRASLRRLHDPSGTLIDEAVMVCYHGPRSFTGEDLVEFTLHGGRAVAQHFVSACLALAPEIQVRFAQAGEFTRRAFDAGRLDLTQAEAIVDLIEAETPRQKAKALSQLDGAMSTLAKELGEALLDGLAGCEAMIDFSDEGDVPDDLRAIIRLAVSRVQDRVTAALASARTGQALRDGLQFVILGAPNAGKSTLLNALAGWEAAIVSDIPGTTRDVVRVRLAIAGVPVILSDTAGLRTTTDPVETEGVRRARIAADAADLRIWLVAANGAARHAPKEATPGDIVLLSQCDRAVGADPALPRGFDFAVSAHTGEGMDRLRLTLEAEVARMMAGAEDAIVTRERHRIMLEGLRGSCDRAVVALDNGLDIELVAEHLRQGRSALDRLTGRLDVEAILGQIFSRFCIGK